MKRVVFYFDGFNFYNGLRDKSKVDNNWKNYYWIDIVKFCQQFVFEGSEISEVKYFTSPPMNKHKRSRQTALLSANKIINPTKFNVFNGNYQNRSVRCEADCKQPFHILEEKRTDVSISVNMLLDCFNNTVDTLVLISADSDQVPTIQAIKTHFPEKKIKVYFPPKRNCTEIFNICKPIVFLEENEDRFKRAMMPHIVEIEGKKYTKPEKWCL